MPVNLWFYVILLEIFNFCIVIKHFILFLGKIIYYLYKEFELYVIAIVFSL